MQHHIFWGKMALVPSFLYQIYGDPSRIYTLCRSQTEIKRAVMLFVIQRQARGVNESNNRQNNADPRPPVAATATNTQQI